MPTNVTIIGNTTAPAELKFTPSGAAVVNFTVAQTDRKRNTDTQQWEDGDTIFMRCTAWQTLAENIAETLHEKGMPVIVTGRLKQRSYETKEGEKRTLVEVDVESAGPDLRRCTAAVTRTPAQGGTRRETGPTPFREPWPTTQQTTNFDNPPF